MVTMSWVLAAVTISIQEPAATSLVRVQRELPLLKAQIHALTGPLGNLELLRSRRGNLSGMASLGELAELRNLSSLAALATLGDLADAPGRSRIRATRCTAPLGSF